MVGTDPRRRSRRWLAALAVLGCALVAAPSAGATATRLGAGVYATAIASTGQGLWFGGSSYVGGYDVVGRIAPDGTLTEYRLPPGRTPTRELTGIAAGPAGNLWLSSNEGKLLRVTPTGTAAEVPVPLAGNQAIVLGPDGALRFSSRQGALGRTNASGESSVVGLPAGSEPQGVTVGPDGAIWIAERGADAIARVSGEGAVSQFPLPHPASRPAAIATGPDGNLWFSEEGAPRIGRITPGGAITEFKVPGRDGTRLIANGPAGDLWYSQGNQVGSITTSGASGEPTCIEPECRTTIDAIAAGPNGELLLATGVRETTPGGDVSAPELGLAGAIETFVPPPLATTITAAPKFLGGRVVAVPLACHGGLAGDTCGGHVRLRSGARFAGGGGYRLAPMTGERLRVTLGDWAARALARRGKLRLRVSVFNAGGSGAARTVVLRARRHR
ncbi:MAG: hypothetical protein JST31_08525 [Actinobacteria bacterium]|nr:hypothetical protein [Actinomycetota bacterium]